MKAEDPFDCPHGKRCGGCAYLGVPYTEQLLAKGAAVKSAFAHYAEHASLSVEAVSGAESTLDYRVRAKLAWDASGALGLFARDSHAVVDIPECRVLAPALQRVTAAARRSLGPLSKILDGIDLRLVDRGVLVTLIAARDTPLPALERAARALCAASAEVVGVAASFRAAGSATLLGTGHVPLIGSEVEPHRIKRDGPFHLVTHGAFTQVHLGQAARAHLALASAVRSLKAQRVLELYAGSATISLALAAQGFELTAVDSFGPALAQAERAAREQGLRLRTRHGPTERVARELCAAGERFDAVIVNPPRRGLSYEAREAIARLEPEAILYMSCNPATLARDLCQLREFGWSANDIQPFDMIPQSDAVECLVIVRRAALPELKIAHLDDELIAVSKSAYGARSSSLGQSLLARVRSLPGATDAVPVCSLDADWSGLALFARTPQRLPSLRRALADGSLGFIGLARGITHKKGQIRRGLNGSPGSPSTRYRRSEVKASHSLLAIEPDRAEPEQIRRHFAAIGHPLLGDRRYGDPASNTFFEHRHGLDRSFLHFSSARLVLASGPLELSAALPGELAAVLESLSHEPAPERP
jgi:23S rRNA (uracil1939-C5)-methyltransferase